FQILQMQEQMRKMQEDNEFRFQELEQKKTDAGAPAGNPARRDDSSVASAEPAPPQTPTGDPTIASGQPDALGVPMEPEVLVDNRTGEPGGADSLGAAP